MTSITSTNVNNNNNDGTKKKLQMITCFCGDAFVDIQTSKMNNLTRWGYDTTYDSVQILGFKIGAEWDLLSNLVFSLKSNIRFNRIKGNENDGIDNDNDGEIDNLGEVWSTSNSGIIFSLNYRF